MYRGILKRHIGGSDQEPAGENQVTHSSHEALIKLKILANEFPFLHLENLQEVKASIIKV